MNRTIRLLSVSVALAAIPAIAAAQSQQAFTVGVSAGASVPIGDLGDSHDLGFQVAGHAYLRPASMKGALSFRGDVNFDRWNAKTSSSISSASTRSVGGTANLLYKLGNKDSAAQLYLLGGAGLQNVHAEVTTTVGGIEAKDSASDTKPHVQAGIGMDFPLAGFTSFLEARFVNRFGEGGSSSWIPITFGIHF